MPWDFWLIFLLLGVAIPWRGHVRLKKLLALPSVDTQEKLALYAVTIMFQWAIAGSIAWRAFARGFSVEDLGLGRRPLAPVLAAGLFGAVLIGALQWLNLRRIGKMEGPVPDLLRKLASRLLPVTLLEYLPFSALAITAGICEEFIYRGFVMGALHKLLLPVWAVVALSAILFGLAHAYQGRGGIISTGLFGVVLAIGRIGFDNLVPVMMWHASLDLVAGRAAAKFLLLRAAAEMPEGK
jgi:membrane protease YdiL (CAAX protease family)